MYSKRLKIIIGSTAAAITAGAVSGIAIAVSNAEKNKKEYDFGIVVAPVNSLNYVKYAPARDIVGATIPPLITGRPSHESKSSSYIMKESMIYWQRTDLLGQGSVTDYNEASNAASHSFDSYYMKNYFNPVLNKKSNIRVSGDKTSKAGIHGFMGFIDKDMRWNDGARVSASSFIDYIDLILDLNTYSTLIEEVENFGISGATNFIDAQKDYYKKFKTLYKKPRGVHSKDVDGKTIISFPSQEPGDSAYVEKIKEAYGNIGIYGDEYSSRPYKTFKRSIKLLEGLTKSKYDGSEDTMEDFVNVEREIFKNSFKGFNDKQKTELSNDSMLFVQFQKTATTSEGMSRLTESSLLMPVNMDVINKIGIERLGMKCNEMPYVGAYRFDAGALGANGYLSIEKNPNFPYKDDVFTNHIKFYFSTNENVNYAMYQDGYIGSTPITPMKVSELFSDLVERENIKKPFATATEGFAFNLDKTSRDVKPENDPIQYASFRKAMFYAINREQILKIAQQDSSLVKSNFTSLLGTIDQTGNYMSSIITLDERGVQPVTGFTPSGLSNLYSDGPTVNAYIQPLSNDQTETLTKQYDLQSRYSIDALFESADRFDKVTNIALARKFFDKFKKEWKTKTGSEFNTYAVKYLYPSEAKGESIGISLNNQMKNAFSGAITIDMKGYSSQIFDDFKMQGKFDITYGELAGSKFTSDNTNPVLFIRKLLMRDNVEDGDTFLNNPTGGWVFDDILARIYPGSAEETDLISRLHIHPSDLKVIRALLKFTPYEESLKTSIGASRAEKERIERIRAFIKNNEYLQNGVNQTHEILSVFPTYSLMAKRANMIAQFDKLVLEDSPVIPVTIAGQGWQANRMFGSMKHGTVYQLEYTFDKKSIPRADLQRLV